MQPIRTLSSLLTKSSLSKPWLFGKERLNQLTDELSDRQFKASLDIGSGPTPRNPFHAKTVYGTDIRVDEKLSDNVRLCNLATERLPFEDGSLDCVTAFDVLEHIPRIAFLDGSMRFSFVELMNEIWRVLDEDGIFFSSTPCYPFKHAFQDPTHVNILTEDTLNNYFGEKAWARIYGYYGSFKVVNEGWNGVHFFCAMQKSSSVAMYDLSFIQQ